MAIMSQRAYARHRGMAVFAVQTAIKKGRISTLPDGQVDSDVADREWDANTRKDPPKVKINSKPRPAAEDDGDPGGEAFGVSQYTKARAVREHYLARLAKLEFEEKVGNLVSKDEVKIAQFNIDRQRRDAVLNIPDRICAAIAAEIKDAMVAAGLPADRAIDTTRVYEIVSGEVRKALNDYADSLAN